MSDKTLVERMRDEAKRAREERGLPVYTPEKIEKLADAIEREYLPRPRFEDGEPVQFGDEFVYDKSTGQSSKVFKFGFTTIDGCTIYDSMGNCSLHPKRPEPEVLDADGVPIHKGDTVYFVDCPESFDVLGIERDGDEPVHIGRNDGTATDAWVSPLDITHKQPDSLERIEEDALMFSIDYCDKYGLLDSECNAEEGDEAIRHCTDCGLTCETRMVKHILRRQREVLERNHER